eukprot:CAMPEP_0202455862 /NCGR_PEP_ID=MMETSP1360-20130828/13286_1 /ASSEMBLY_ACC=CAM_ASM_000848 /TAXON_ID=515479 /ORGANISM="Licmophora paradoxa, Strain CCMP2313" /LENGTH=332 /DNA_ID=CAMNT_0049075545 /DNA_START=44 /DNA_END=1042 /DNA_ORIENTATION=-
MASVTTRANLLIISQSLSMSSKESFSSTHKQAHQDEQHSEENLSLVSKLERSSPRGGVAVPFPEKLHLMLSKADENGFSHIVSWQPHGRCFLVHKPKLFVEKIMPEYFRQTKMTSFQRQLNLYDFNRFSRGKDRSGYYHELFLRGKPQLCKRIMRVRVKGGGPKANVDPNLEPDFYGMPFVYADSKIELNDQTSKLENPFLTSAMETATMPRSLLMDDGDISSDSIYSFPQSHLHSTSFPQAPDTTATQMMFPPGISRTFDTQSNIFEMTLSNAAAIQPNSIENDQNLRQTIAEMQLNMPINTSTQTNLTQDDLALAMEVRRLIEDDGDRLE